MFSHLESFDNWNDPKRDKKSQKSLVFLLSADGSNTANGFVFSNSGRLTESFLCQPTLFDRIFTLWEIKVFVIVGYNDIRAQIKLLMFNKTFSYFFDWYYCGCTFLVGK